MMVDAKIGLLYHPVPITSENVNNLCVYMRLSMNLRLPNNIQERTRLKLAKKYQSIKV